MIPSSYFASLASALALLALVDARPSDLVAIACERNPSLAMCGGGNSANAGFRAADAPDDEDTRYMRSFPKMDFDDLQVKRYCERHQDHYSHYCVGEGRIENKLKAKVLKFCPSFEKYCPEVAQQLTPEMDKRSLDEESFRDAGVPLVIPPPLPSASQMGGLAFDSPISEERGQQIPERQPETALSPDLIKTCTPDCTAPHCTNECKCANTHPSVHAKCNPPATAALASVCQAWYNKCPMFKPVSY